MFGIGKIAISIKIGNFACTVKVTSNNTYTLTDIITDRSKCQYFCVCDKYITNVCGPSDDIPKA